MEKIDSNNDIRKFIDSNVSNSLPPYKFDYIPYISELGTKKDEKLFPKEIVQNVQTFINNVFSEIPTIEPSDSEIKVDNELHEILNIAIEGKKLPNEIKIIFMEHVSKRKNRRTFLNKLNNIRISGMFTLEHKSYYIVSDLLYCILNNIQEELDFESAKILFSIAQTMYKTASEPNKPRMFLQKSLEGHPLLSDSSFWKGYLKYTINEELLSQKNYNIYTFETSESKAKRLETIYFNQLHSIGYLMTSFRVQLNIIKELIGEQFSYYDIEEKKREQLMNDLNEYHRMNEEAIKASTDSEESSSGDISIISESFKMSTEITEPNNEEEQ